MAVHNKIGGSRFINMCVANWFLHIYVYALIPLVASKVQQAGGNEVLIGWGVMAFAIGMFLPGPFGAHLMERRSRKEVFLKAVIGLGLVATAGYQLFHHLYAFVVLQLLQGMCFGIAQTALGATLVNDTLQSKQRNRGDLIYGWAGRIGIPLGFFLGYLLLFIFPLQQAFWWVLIPCALAFLLVGQTNVPIKAPVKVPLITLDRFFMPRSLMLGLSMFAAPWMMGRIAGSECDVWCFLRMAIGVFIAFVMQTIVRRSIEQTCIMILGYASVIMALILLNVHYYMTYSIAYMALGCGIGTVSSRHLMDWIMKVEHCQRGTAQNTYILMWRLSFSCGFLVSCYHCISNYSYDILLCIAGIAVYMLWVGRKPNV